jgi:ABC-type sugar transport system substrate-binding protein
MLGLDRLSLGNHWGTSAVKTISLVLLSALLWTTQAFADPTLKRPQVVFLNPGKSGEVFWDLVSDTMRAAGKQLKVDVEIINSERNRRMLNDLGMAIVNRAERPDYLILVNEESAATPVIEAANAKGIKTFLLSNAFTGEEAKRYGAPREVLENWIGSLSPDMQAASKRMAGALIEKAKLAGHVSADGKLHLLALGGDELTPNSITRNDGFNAYVSTRSDVVVDRFLLANWNAAEAETLTTRYLDWAEHAGIRPAGIWAANDPMALGAIEAIASKGLEPGKDMAVVGLNWSPEALAAIKDGKLLLTDGGHFFGGAWSIVMLRDYADGCDFAREGAAKTFPLASIDQSNLSMLAGIISERRFEAIRFEQFLASRNGRCGAYDFSLDALMRASRATAAN